MSNETRFTLGELRTLAELSIHAVEGLREVIAKSPGLLVIPPAVLDELLTLTHPISWVTAPTAPAADVEPPDIQEAMLPPSSAMPEEDHYSGVTALGKILRSWRTAQDMTSGDMAGRLGVDHALLLKWETHGDTAPDGLFDKLTQAFEMDPTTQLELLQALTLMDSRNAYRRISTLMAKHPGTVYTAEDIAKKLDLNLNTARTHLASLARRAVVYRRTNGHFYWPPHGERESKRQRILGIFMNRPGDTFTTRDIADLLGTDSADASRHFDALKNSGMIVKLGNGLWRLAELRGGGNKPPTQTARDRIMALFEHAPTLTRQEAVNQLTDLTGPTVDNALLDLVKTGRLSRHSRLGIYRPATADALDNQGARPKTSEPLDQQIRRILDGAPGTSFSPGALGDILGITTRKVDAQLRKLLSQGKIARADRGEYVSRRAKKTWQPPAVSAAGQVRNYLAAHPGQTFLPAALAKTLDLSHSAVSGALWSEAKKGRLTVDKTGRYTVPDTYPSETTTAATGPEPDPGTDQAPTNSGTYSPEELAEAAKSGLFDKAPESHQATIEGRIQHLLASNPDTRWTLLEIYDVLGLDISLSSLSGHVSHLKKDGIATYPEPGKIQLAAPPQAADTPKRILKLLREHPERTFQAIHARNELNLLISTIKIRDILVDFERQGLVEQHPGSHFAIKRQAAKPSEQRALEIAQMDPTYYPEPPSPWWIAKECSHCTRSFLVPSHIKTNNRCYRSLETHTQKQRLTNILARLHEKGEPFSSPTITPLSAISAANA